MELLRAKPRLLHALRSVMFAGAGAVVWLALSSTAANADSGDNHSLLDGTTSAATKIVSSAEAGISSPLGKVASAVPVTASPLSLPRVAAPTPPVPAAPAIHVPVPQVSGIVERELPQLTQAVDQVVASTPAVNAVVPDGTVAKVTKPLAAVAEPLVSPATGTVGGIVDGVVSSAVDKLPIGVPDLVLPVPDIEIPGESGAGAVPSDFAVALESFGAEDQLLPEISTLGDPAGTSAAPFAATGLAPPLRNAPTSNHSAPDSSFDGMFPPGLPRGIDAGVGSGSVPTTPSGGAAAWLPDSNFYLPSGGPLAPSPSACRIPAAVSFDPGSSPD